MEANDEAYDVRPEAEIMREMEAVAIECETGPSEDRDDARKPFDRALRLMLEMRVPRMPETDAELAAMLDEARGGDTYTTEQVFEHLEASGRRFARLRAEYDLHLSSGSWLEAARMLLPADGDRLVGWNERFRVDVAGGTGDAGFTATAQLSDGLVACTSPAEGTALLGAIMRAHSWRAAWHR